MAPVMIWPRILAITRRLLYMYKINFNYIEDTKSKLSMKDVLFTIFSDFLYFQNYLISIILEIQKIIKFENCGNN